MCCTWCATCNADCPLTKVSAEIQNLRLYDFGPLVLIPLCAASLLKAGTSMKPGLAAALVQLRPGSSITLYGLGFSVIPAQNVVVFRTVDGNVQEPLPVRRQIHSLSLCRKMQFAGS